MIKDVIADAFLQQILTRPADYAVIATPNLNGDYLSDAAAAQVKGYEKGGENEIFLDYAKKFAVLRPVTPGYPFIATEFTKTAQDILNGADPKQALDQAVKDIDANQKSNGYFQ